MHPAATLGFSAQTLMPSTSTPAEGLKFQGCHRHSIHIFLHILEIPARHLARLLRSRGARMLKGLVGTDSPQLGAKRRLERLKSTFSAQSTAQAPSRIVVGELVQQVNTIMTHLRQQINKHNGIHVDLTKKSLKLLLSSLYKSLRSPHKPNKSPNA